MTATYEPLLKTSFTDIELFKRGKVRDVYDLKDKLLVVSTDSISCFDLVLPTGIPHKGEILTQLSLFWFDLTNGYYRQSFYFSRRLAIPERTAKVRRFPERPVDAGKEGKDGPC